MKRLLSIALLTSVSAFAQPINDRWVGTWQEGKTKMTITAKTFGDCLWSDKAVNATKKCLAFYSGTTQKKDLEASLAQEYSNIDGWLKDKHITPADHANFKKDLDGYRRVLGQVSDDRFRMIKIDQGPDGSPDSSVFYFLDKTFVYAVFRSQGGLGPSWGINQLRKVN